MALALLRQNLPLGMCELGLILKKLKLLCILYVRIVIQRFKPIRYRPLPGEEIFKVQSE